MEQQNLPTSTSGNRMEPMPIRFAMADTEDAATGADGGDGLKRALAAAIRYKWLVLLIAVLGTAAGVFASRFVAVEYTAEATIWIEGSDQNSERQGPIQSSELLHDNAWVELLRSYAVLDYVASENRLYLGYAGRDRDVMEGFRIDTVSARGAFRLRVADDGSTVELTTEDGRPVSRSAVGEPIGAAIGFLWQPPAAALTPGREVSFTVVAPRDAARQLNDQLQSRKAERGNFVRLQYGGTDPELVAAVLNSVADRFVSIAAELKRKKLLELRDILKEQLTFAGTNLDEAELELEGFRVSTITEPSEPSAPVAAGLQSTQASVLSHFFELKIQRDQIERDRNAVGRWLDAADRAVSVDALSAVASVQQSPELMQTLQELATKRADVRGLLQLYTREHPAVHRAEQGVQELEMQTLPRLARELVQELGNQMNALENLIASASTELRQIPPRALEEARLTRSVTSAENMYLDLRRRYENASLAAETTVPDVSILDYAPVPQRPSSDERNRIMLLAALASLGLGLAVAVLLERLDPRIQYPEQISEGLRLPILGAIPEVKSRRGLIVSADRAAMLEALRGIRLSLGHAYGAAGPVMATISSPGSGDGKTFVASNLALTFADLGMRVLLIDGDTRRGTVHRVLDVARRPGLTDYLAGSFELERVIRPTSHAGLDVITCGTRLGNAPELLASPRMGELLGSIRSRYEVVLIDSPPLGAGVDPLVLATLSGHIVVVMRTGKTDRSMAAAKLEMLDNLPIRVLGAVVNGISANAGYRYYSYLPGYEAEQEESMDEPANLLQPS